RDDAGQQERAAVKLAFAAAQEIDGGDRRRGSEERRQRSQKRNHRQNQEGEYHAQRRSAGNAEHVGIGKGIAQQGLKTSARDGESSAHENAEQDSGQADVHDDQLEIAGKLLRMSGYGPPEIPRKFDERKRHRAQA